MRNGIILSLTGCLALGLAAPGARGEETPAKSRKEIKADEKRAEIDRVAREALDRVLADSKVAADLYEKAVGHAVFDNLKISFILSGGGGVGVAVEKETGRRTYMKMGTAGLNIGLGAQKYQVVFLFESRETMRKFIEKGWQADAQANAVAGTAGANAEATFQDGMAFFVLTEGGLMLQADISGTKYWKYEKLNE